VLDNRSRGRQINKVLLCSCQATSGFVRRTESTSEESWSASSSPPPVPARLGIPISPAPCPLPADDVYHRDLLPGPIVTASPVPSTCQPLSPLARGGLGGGWANGSPDAPRYPAHQRAHQSHLRHRRPRSVPKVVRKVSKCLHLHTAEKIYPFDHNSQNQSFPRSWKWKENLLVFDVVQNRQTEICSGSHLRRLSPDAKYWSEKSVTCWR